MTGTVLRSIRAGAAPNRLGLTIIEVLVALTVLAIVATAIVAAFSLFATLNRGSAAEVDVGRAVRTISEKIINDWRTTSEWEEGSVGGESFAGYIALVASDGDGGQFCTGSFTPDVSDVTAPVRTVVIECDVDEGGQSTFIFQVGSPL